MRILMMVAVAAVAQLLGVDDAEARRDGGISIRQDLHFIGQTGITGADNQLLSLCHVSTMRHVSGVGLWRSSQGYALSQTWCAGDRFVSLTPDMLAEAKSAGLIPASVQSVPKMSTGMVMTGFWGTGVILLALALAVLKVTAVQLRAAKRRARRAGRPSGAPVVLSVITNDRDIPDTDMSVAAGVANSLDIPKDKMRQVAHG